MSAYQPKPDVGSEPLERPLVTHSGHICFVFGRLKSERKNAVFGTLPWIPKTAVGRDFYYFGRDGEPATDSHQSSPLNQ